MLTTSTNLLANRSRLVANNYNTASFTNQAGKLHYFVAYSQASSGTPNVPTISGQSLSYTQVATKTNGSSERITIFSFTGNGNTGVTNIDYGGQNQNYCVWLVDYFTNVSQTASAVQTASASADTGATSFSVTLAAFANSQNATYACVGKPASNAVTPGGSMVQLGFASSNTANVCAGESQFISSNLTNPTGTFVGSGGDSYVALAVELNFAADANGAFLYSFL